MSSGLSLGAKIRQQRLSLKLTQAELAGPEFTKSFISQIEKGQTRPSLKSLQVIARRLNQPISFFLGEEEGGSRSTEIDSILKEAAAKQTNARLRDAIEDYTRALGKCHASHHATKGEIYFRLGHIYFALREYSKAQSHFHLAVDELSRADSAYDLRVRAYSDLASTYYQLNQYSKARETYEKALSLADLLPSDDVQVRLTILSNLGNVLARLNQFGPAVTIGMEALRLSQDKGDYFLFGKLCHTLGYVYDALGEYQKAIEYTEMSNRFYRSVQDHTLALATQINLAAHLRKNGRGKRARETAQSVLEVAQSLQLTSGIARAHAELAHLEYDEQHPREALHHLEKAFAETAELEDIPEWVELAVRCAKEEALPQGMLDTLERVARKWNGNPRGLAEIHSHLGELYNELGDTAKANEHLSKSVSIFRST